MADKISTICRFCGKQCHLLAQLDEKGKVEKVYPDRRYKSVWCRTGKSVLELMNHPDRVRVPLERTGARGEGKWREISWETAFEKIGYEFNKVIKEYGCNSFLGIRGFNKPYFNAIYERWMNRIGSVNSMGAANMCHFPSMAAARETFGFFPRCTITKETKFLVLWGSNPYNTDKERAAQIWNARKRGMKLVVIDPCHTKHAEEADYWLPILPGKDMALAMGIIHLIIENEWYDVQYIQNCTYGFDELKKCSEKYTLKWTEQVTGIQADIIEKVTKMLAFEGPGIIEIGNAMDHNADSFQKSRAVNILIGITGNVDRAGALNSRGSMSKRQIEQRKIIAQPQNSPYNDPEKRRKIIGYQERYIDIFNESSGSDLAKAMNLSTPYPIKACYVQGGNPAMIWEDREELVNAFLKLDFMVVSDFFITPTAMLADIILPAAMYMEYESVYVDRNDTLYYCSKLVDGNCKSDLEIINEIAKVMGYENDFWKTMEDYWNTFLRPYGIDLEQMRCEKIIFNPRQEDMEIKYGKYRKNGFPTESGKIQLYSDNMKRKGNDPIPIFNDFAKTTLEYPYLATNYKSQYFYQTAGHQLESARKLEADPIAFVSGDIAEKCDIKSGEYIKITTDVGSVIQKAKVEKEMAEKTIALSHGWWYPKKEKDPFVLSACANNIVYDKKMIGKEIPSFTTRGVPCKVEKYRKYDELFPVDSEKKYNIRIQLTEKEDYMNILAQLENKGFMEGNPNLILEEDQDVKRIIPLLEQKEYKITLLSEGMKEGYKEYLDCDAIYFRIYGFSQNTYDRVNGYNWKKIKSNIEKEVKKLKDKVLCKIEYFMYQYNFEELYLVKQWAEQLGINLEVKYASFDDSLKLKYVSSKMSTKDMIHFSKMYFFTLVDQLNETKASLYNHFVGKEDIVVDSKKNIIFDWDVTNEGKPLEQIKDYCEWRQKNQVLYEKNSLNQATELWWLWKKMENECK